VIEDFLTIREEWNRYRLMPESLTLRAKVYPVEIKSVDGKIQFEFAQIFRREKSEDEEDKGSPSADQTITDADIIKVWEFERVYESINIYDVPRIKKLILCKPVLESFNMTGKFSAKGKRMYRTTFRLAVAPIDYPPDQPPKDTSLSKTGQITIDG
jgi:hypothetical protein